MRVVAVPRSALAALGTWSAEHVMSAVGYLNERGEPITPEAMRAASLALNQQADELRAQARALRIQADALFREARQLNSRANPLQRPPANP